MIIQQQMIAIQFLQCQLQLTQQALSLHQTRQAAFKVDQLCQTEEERRLDDIESEHQTMPSSLG